MRIALLLVVLLGGCRFFKPAQQPAAPVSDSERLRQMQEEQRAENARAEKHRRFERAQAASNAVQATQKD
jgi:hypothetical protein